MKHQSIAIALCVTAVVLAACPFNNPYAYWAQACTSSEDCGGGLVCDENSGTCRGATCEADTDCGHEYLSCVGGACVLEGIEADAGAESDATPGSDAATGADSSVAPDSATAADSATGVDTTATPDAAVGSDATTGADVGGGSDAGGVADASVATDAATGADTSAATDAALPDAWTPCADDLGCAGQAGPRCVAGHCVPESCAGDDDCGEATWGLTCVLPPGVCSPSSCGDHPDCLHPWLGCTNNTCALRSSRAYDPCFVEPGGGSGCTAPLHCVKLYNDQSIGFCAVSCDSNSGTGVSCLGDYTCVPLDEGGRLAPGGSGVCLASCSQAADFAPYPPDLLPPLACSLPGGPATGLLYPNYPRLSEMRASCSGGVDCEPPMVCASAGSPRASRCMLLPEALVWQASDQATIERNIGRDNPCPAGLIPMTANSGPDLCVARCSWQGDCKLVVPPGPMAECYRPNPIGVGEHWTGLCQPQATGGGCWLRGFAALGNQCRPNGTEPDDDLDGLPDSWEGCPGVFSASSGCYEPGMCRHQDDCDSTAPYCVAGVCSADLAAHCSFDGSCGNELTAVPMQQGAICNPAGDSFLCLPAAQYGGLPFATVACVYDSGCDNQTGCTGGACTCLGNTCYPRSATCWGEYLESGCIQVGTPPVGPLPCAADVDCPASMRCDAASHYCHMNPQRDLQACETAAHCPQSFLCMGGFCFGAIQEAPFTPPCTGANMVASLGACLDCSVFDDPANHYWTRPLQPDPGGCPCGTIAEGGVCYGARSFCNGGQCPLNQHCVDDRCQPGAPTSPPCGAGLEPVGDQCGSCDGWNLPPASWNIPCHTSLGLECPCGLVCIPDDNGDGMCIAAEPVF